MSKPVLIIGSPGSGKSERARQIIGSRKYVEIDGGVSANTQMNQICATVTAETEVILVEGILPYKLDGVKQLVHGTKILVRRPYARNGKVIPMPDLVFTTNAAPYEFSEGLLARVDLVKT